jgi:hypothetical protein
MKTAKPLRLLLQRLHSLPSEFPFGVTRLIPILLCATSCFGEPPTTWSWLHPSPAGSVYNVIFENKQFIAFGEGANLSVSSNGTDWTSSRMTGAYPEVWLTPFAPSGVESLAYGNGKWMATLWIDDLVGSSNLLGEWGVPQNVPEGFRFNDVVFGRRGFVALGPGVYAHSRDAINWNIGFTGHPALIPRKLAYGSGKYVAVGLGGIAIMSKDGSNWQPSQLPTTSNLNAIAFSRGTFLTVAEGGDAFRSRDGKNWRFCGTTPARYAPRVLPSSRGFHVVDQSSEFRRCFISLHGAISESTLPLGTTGLARGGGVSVAVGRTLSRSHVLATSRNEREWIIRSEQFTQAGNITGIDRAHGRFVAISDGGDIAVTDDFLHFDRPQWDLPPLASIDSSSNVSVVVGARGTILYSEHGYFFSVFPPIAETNDFRRVKFAGDRFFAFAQNLTLQSRDGKNWASSNSPPGYWNDVEFGNGLYVLTRGDTFRVSTDGETWSDPNNGDCCGVDILTFANGKFYGMWGPYLFSFSDPTNVRLELIGTHTLRVISSFEGGLLAYGDNGEAHYSADGVSWNKAVGSPMISVRGIAVHDGNIYLTGSGIVRGIPSGVPARATSVPH